MKGKVDIEYDYYCNSSSNDSTNFIKQGIFVFLNEKKKYFLKFCFFNEKFIS